MMNGLLYYSSKYGTTERIAKWICSSITCANVQTAHIGNDIQNISADFYILGIPIYIGKPLPGIIEVLQSLNLIINDKPLFLYIVSWAQSTPFNAECVKFLELIHGYLRPCRPILSCSLPGWLDMEQLTPPDRRVMGRLLRRLDTMSDQFDSSKLKFVDRSDEQKSKQFGCDINRWLENKSSLF